MVGLVVGLVIDMGVGGGCRGATDSDTTSNGVCLDGVEVVVMLVFLGR